MAGNDMPDSAAGQEAEVSEALLARIAAGSEEALTAFYRLHEGSVYAFALRRIGDAAAAADVLNEVMLEVWRGAQRFQGRSRVRTWLLGITHHKVVDLLRKRGRHEADELPPDLADTDAVSAVDALSGAQDAVLLRRCLERLPDTHRQVVHMAFFDELSYPEIAVILACPEGTVKTRMFHARAKLKRCLAALGAEAP